MKYVIFIPDGSSDYPIDELDGMTPLMAADTPNIDKMAKEGFGGLTNNVPDAYTPGSDVANMSIFGFCFNTNLANGSNVDEGTSQDLFPRIILI